MKTSEILISAKKLIDTPEKWTTDALARTFTGNSTFSGDPRAVCFCSAGAGLRIANGNKILWREIDARLSTVMGGDIAKFNDSHTHAEVMEAWDKAIALAFEEEAKT